MNEELIRLKFSDKTTQWFPLSTMSGEVRTEGLTVIVDDIVLNNTMSGVANYELADGTALTFPLAISGQKVTFPMTTQLVRDGEVKLQLEIYDGNNVYKSAVYKYIVNKSLGYVTITNEEQQLIQSIVIEENKRVTNENTRIENESTRVSSEIVRIENENVRIENENARVSSEIVRIENENVRELSEEERVSSETVRIENEETRVSNENTRIANENARKSAETNRVASMTDIEKRFASLTTAQQQQAEVADARMDAHGTVHANLKTRLDEDFKELASKIPTDVAMNGYESVTTNDTLSGEVSSAVLSGNTMVNIVTGGADTVTQTNTSMRVRLLNRNFNCKANTDYTFVCTISENTSPEAITLTCKRISDSFNAYPTVATAQNGVFIRKLNYSYEWYVESISGRNPMTGSFKSSNIILLEGDHTDKPLEFFEGLKSAEVSEISTHGVNLVYDIQEGRYYSGATPTIDAATMSVNAQVYKGKTYKHFRGLSGVMTLFRKNGDYVGILPSTPTFTPPEDGVLKLSSPLNLKGTEWIYEVTPNTPTEYIPYQESKLTFAPIKLRSLPNGVADTYDVDTGVLTRRCGEVVLNGSESGWQGVSVHPFNSDLLVVNGDLYPLFNNGQIGNYNYKNNISNHFNSGVYQEIIDKDRGEVFGFSGRYVRLAITKSKLPTPDIAGFKAWLSANPTTVVYQLATPTTEYIENNGQLRSYDSQTTVFANSIVPVKIGGNIPVNYASTLANLATQARNLRIENTALIEQAESLSEQLNIAEETNDFQDELIDVSLMATDELYVMLEPLLAQPMMSSKNTQNVSDETTKDTQGGNAMVDAYVAMVIRGLKTIDEVPARYREEVRRILAELDK